MARIDRLTKDQKKRFQEFVDKWTKIGLSTDPANRERAENGIRIAYKIAGLEPPRIVWCGSPFSQGLTRAIVIGLKSPDVGNSVGASVWASVMASVWDSVGDSVMASVGDSVRASVWDSVRASVMASVMASVGDSVWDSVRASVGDSVRASVWDSVRASVGDSGYGQHDAHWLGFYDYFSAACGLSEETQKLTGLWEISQNAGWFLPHEKICWVSERHNVLNRDDRGRLHCENGQAISYPDGWSIWAIHGVRLSQRIVEQPETITVAEIDKEANAEIRRVLMDRYGQARYLCDSGAKKIHADDFGTLYRKDIPNDEPLVMVKVVNSTREPDGSFKDYFLRVPPNIRTAREAVAWTFDVQSEQYQPLVES